MNHRILAAMITGVLLLLSAGTSGSEVTCLPLRLKPIHCVCGSIINSVGAPVDDATVTLLKDGIALAVVHTHKDGEFSFDVSSPGNYEIKSEAYGFRAFQFPVTVVKPQARCKRALNVKLITGGEVCSGVWLVKR